MSAAAMVQGAGSLVGAYGQLQMGYAEEAAAELNAAAAEENAVLTLQKAIEDERRLRVMGRKTLGDIRTGYAASGVTAEGSALDVLKESAANIELDALNVKFEGEARAKAFRNEARMERYRGEMAVQNARIGAAATLLTGGASAMAKMPGSKTGSTGGSTGGRTSTYYSHTKGDWDSMA